MANAPIFNIPSPPDDANIHDMHQWSKDMWTFLTTVMSKGLQPAFFTGDQLSQMTNIDQAGKMFFNQTTGKFMVSEVSGGNISLKTITTS